MKIRLNLYRIFIYKWRFESLLEGNYEGRKGFYWNYLEKKDWVLRELLFLKLGLDYADGVVWIDDKVYFFGEIKLYNGLEIWRSLLNIY